MQESATSIPRQPGQLSFASLNGKNTILQMQSQESTESVRTMRPRRISQLGRVVSAREALLRKLPGTIRAEVDGWRQLQSMPFRRNRSTDTKLHSNPTQ